MVMLIAKVLNESPSSRTTHYLTVFLLELCGFKYTISLYSDYQNRILML